MGVPVLVLPSPLLPEAAYDGLLEALRQRGAQARVGPAGLTRAGDPTDLIRRWAGLIGSGTLLVPHSNAGYLAPVARSLSRYLPAVVFMDAALPPASGTTPLAPPRFRTVLADLADGEGLLPPWTRWWPRDEVDHVIPGRLFAILDEACPRLPVSYFDQEITAPPGWANARNAYLAFGDTYAEELGFAVRHGWPHARIDGGHLHFLHDPGTVAARVLDLATEL